MLAEVNSSTSTSSSSSSSSSIFYFFLLILLLLLLPLHNTEWSIEISVMRNISVCKRSHVRMCVWLYCIIGDRSVSEWSTKKKLERPVRNAARGGHSPGTYVDTYSIVHYCAAQYITVQYSTVQCSTLLYLYFYAYLLLEFIILAFFCLIDIPAEWHIQYCMS